MHLAEQVVDRLHRIENRYQSFDKNRVPAAHRRLSFPDEE